MCERRSSKWGTNNDRFCLLTIRHPRPTIKPAKKSRNRNNNRASFTAIDVAECIDGDIESVAGLPILLARGTLILTDDEARTVRSNQPLMPGNRRDVSFVQLNAMTTFDRLRYFQRLTHPTP